MPTVSPVNVPLTFCVYFFSLSVMSLLFSSGLRSSHPRGWGGASISPRARAAAMATGACGTPGKVSDCSWFLIARYSLRVAA